MPIFRSQARPRGGIAEAVRAMVGSSGELSAADQIGAEQAAANISRNTSLAEKAREEVAQMQASARARTDPTERARYASTASGLNLPVGEELLRHIEGSPVVRPNVTPEQERSFRAALASVLATTAATGHTNAEQLTHGGGNLLVQALRSEMSAPGTDIPRGNQLATAAGLKTREPYSGGASPAGLTVNQETGATAVGEPLLHRAAVAASQALATQRNAAGTLATTRAGDITATQPSRIDVNAARAQQIRTPAARPAPGRTQAQEDRDRAYAARQDAATAKANKELEDQKKRDAKTKFTRDPKMKGQKLGVWVPGKGYEILSPLGTVIGHYDEK